MNLTEEFAKQIYADTLHKKILWQNIEALQRTFFHQTLLFDHAHSTVITPYSFFAQLDTKEYLFFICRESMSGIDARTSTEMRLFVQLSDDSEPLLIPTSPEIAEKLLTVIRNFATHSTLSTSLHDFIQSYLQRSKSSTSDNLDA